MCSLCKILISFYLTILFLLILPLRFPGIVFAADYTWKTDAVGDWLTADNWSPDGFTNSNSDTAEASSGTLQSGVSATFQPKLTLNTGAEILAASANGRTWTLRDVVLDGGTLRCQGGNSSFVGTIEAKTGSTSYLDAGSGSYSSSSNSWTLKGGGTLEKKGTSYWGTPATSSDFTGTFLISAGEARGLSGTQTFGGTGGKIRINTGGTFARGSSSSIWTVNDGLRFNGGTYEDNSNNGTVWTSSTKFVIEDNSAIYINGAATGNRPFARIEGELQGSGGLIISESSDNNRGVSFRTTQGSYTGTLTLGINAYVYLGIDIFNTNGTGSVVINSDAKLLTIGAYKNGDTTTDVADVDITITDLTINGNAITAGTYDQSNQDNLGGYVTFNNSTSSLTVLGSSSGELTVDIVDSDGNPVTSPSMTMGSIDFSFSYQTSTGTFGTSSQKIRVNNTTSNGSWTLSLAASDPTDIWESAGIGYDFNDPTASAEDGADDDILGGQLTVNASAGTLAGTCSTSGLSKGSSTSFSEGPVNTITILTAVSADTDCYVDFTGISLSQTIPKEQPVASDYNIDMVLTVVAN